MNIDPPKPIVQNPLWFVNVPFEVAASYSAGQSPLVGAYIHAFVTLPLCLLITVVAIGYVFLYLPVYFVLWSLCRLFRKVMPAS